MSSHCAQRLLCHRCIHCFVALAAFTVLTAHRTNCTRVTHHIHCIHHNCAVCVELYIKCAPTVQCAHQLSVCDCTHYLPTVRWLDDTLSNEEMARRATWVKDQNGKPFNDREFEVILKEMCEVPLGVAIAFINRVRSPRPARDTDSETRGSQTV